MDDPTPSINVSGESQEPPASPPSSVRKAGAPGDDPSAFDRPWWALFISQNWLERKRRQRTVLAGCRRMLRYALEESCQVPVALSQDIARIDHFLIEIGRKPLSELPPDLIEQAAKEVPLPAPPAAPPTVSVPPAAPAGAAPVAAGAAGGGVPAGAGATAPGPAAPAGTAPQAAPTPGEKSESINDLVFRTHNALSALVAPATAESLRATDPAIVSFGLPPVAKFAILGAAFCMLVFVYEVRPQGAGTPNSNLSPETTKASPQKTQNTPSTVTPTPTPTSRPDSVPAAISPSLPPFALSLASPTPSPSATATPSSSSSSTPAESRARIPSGNSFDLSVLMGACLGAFFYLLIKLQPYLENRSFDPKYNSAYLTRFVTGVVAGVILAYVAAAIFRRGGESTPGTGIGEAIKSLSPAIVGIVGGFSAEAVEQILQRLVEVLLSLVRGDNSAQVEAKLSAQQNAKFADVRERLDALDKTKNDPVKFQAEMDTAKALLKKAAC